MGSVSYLIIFLPGLSTTVQDLHSSLRKDVRFEFTAHHTAIAKKVLKQLVSSEVLAFPDFQAAIDGSRKLQLVTDASKGFGASSEQKQPDGTIRPLLYINRTTLPSEKNWNTSELECGALVWAIKKLRVFLCGIPFELYTDHQPLLSFISMSETKLKST